MSIFTKTLAAVASVVWPATISQTRSWTPLWFEERPDGILPRRGRGWIPTKLAAFDRR